MRLIDHIETNWVQYLVAAIVTFTLAIGISGCVAWQNLPECATVAEYGGTRANVREGTVTREYHNNLWRDCRVPMYLTHP